MRKKTGLSLTIPVKPKPLPRSFDSIRVVVLDFDQTLTTRHVFHSLDKSTSPSDLNKDLFMIPEDVVRVRSLFSFFGQHTIDIYIASRNYRDVVIKWLEHAGITLQPHHVWTDRGLFFHPYDIPIQTSKYGCFEHLLERGYAQHDIMYIDDDNKDIRYVQMAYPGVLAIEKSPNIPLTESFVLSHF